MKINLQSEDKIMNNIKMAQFIIELRKEKKLTQKELAGQLGVTDKAVSKWERGLSCPDISLLSTLCTILGVTISELLNGEKTETVTPEVEAIAEATLQYANISTNNKFKGTRMMYSIILSSISLLGIIVCTICNFAITGKLTWALFPISSIAFVWIIVIPMLVFINRGLFISLVLFSLLIIPFLFLLEEIIGISGLIMPIGIRISAIGIIYLWVTYILFIKTKLKRYISATISVIILIPLGFWINAILSNLIGEPIIDIWDVLLYSILIVLAILIFAFGYKRVRRT